MHRLAQKDQGGDRHHEADHGARERPLGQQCLRDRDRSDDIRVHGHPGQRSDHHTEGISAPQHRLHRALGDPVVDQGADPDPQKQIREHLPQGEGYLPMILRLLAGGKKLWRQETRKMRTHRRIGIFTTS